MPKHKNDDTWKAKATDIAYKEPFSDSTNKTRKQLVFWSAITLLNHFYPINLERSHVLGLHFAEGVAPPLNGLLGLVTAYFTVVLAIYVFQELMSWLAQADEVLLQEYRKSLHDIYEHHKNIQTSVDGETGQLEKHNSALSSLIEVVKISKTPEIKKLEPDINQVEVHRQSFENFCRNLENSNIRFGEEVETAKSMLTKVSIEYRSALVSQLVKVGGLEVFLPFFMGISAVVYSTGSVVDLFRAVTQ